jgi:predicted TIM-barrel fold metal-dependent hydrolase
MIRPRHALFDAHLHIIDPRFPLVANDAFIPTTFSVDDYRRRTHHLNVVGGSVVSGSFQAFDQSYLLDALAELGPRFVGVTQLPVTTSDEEIVSLDAAGVRAVRFNVRRGGSETLTHLDSLARRVFELVGWHTELYIDARDLSELHQVLIALPKVSIDHLGLSRAGLPELLRLVERGAHVKATGFSRGDLDVRATLRDIARANPHSLMVGTDLPSTRSPRPFSDDDIDLVVEALGENLLSAALCDNALALYRPRDAARLPD